MIEHKSHQRLDGKSPDFLKAICVFCLRQVLFRPGASQVRDLACALSTVDYPARGCEISSDSEKRLGTPPAQWLDETSTACKRNSTDRNCHHGTYGATVRAQYVWNYVSGSTKGPPGIPIFVCTGTWSTSSLSSTTRTFHAVAHPRITQGWGHS